MNKNILPARGAERLTDIAALPCPDSGCEIRYFGSISKKGDNADWDWGMYKDENGEWVLAEADGAGCIHPLSSIALKLSAKGLKNGAVISNCGLSL